MPLGQYCDGALTDLECLYAVVHSVQCRHAGKLQAVGCLREELSSQDGPAWWREARSPSYSLWPDVLPPAIKRKRGTDLVTDSGEAAKASVHELAVQGSGLSKLL